jgi:hypothetical protein
MAAPEEDSFSAASAAALREGLVRSEMSRPDLWVAYTAVGGTMTEDELADVLHRHRDITALEHDHVAAALNEHLLERGAGSPVPYSDEIEP